MHGPGCGICGRPATIHETAIDAGVTTTRHLCPEHGEPLLPKVDADALQAMREYYDGLSEAHLALAYRLSRRRS
jgi:hypothetical protein